MTNSRKIKAELIKHLRCRFNLTQDEFADLIGVTPQYVCKMERGIKGITDEMIDKIEQIAIDRLKENTWSSSDQLHK